MADFDVNAARKAGYNDDEILTHLTDTRKFDVQGALKSGYSKPDIISHLAGKPAPAESSHVETFFSTLFNDVTGAPKKIADFISGHPLSDTADAIRASTAGRQIHKQRAVEAYKAGNYKEAAEQAFFGSVPFLGPALGAAADEYAGGDKGAAAAHALEILGPGLLDPAINAIGSETAATMATGVKGAVKGGAKAAVQTAPMTVKGLTLQVPVAATSAAGGAALARAAGLPGKAGAVVGGGAPIIRGMISGAREALAARAALKAGTGTMGGVPTAAAAAAPVADPELLDGLARSLRGTSFDRLKPEQQELIRQIAARGAPSAEAPPPAPVAASPAPPAQAAPPPAPVEQPAAPPAAPALPRTLIDQMDEFLASQRQAAEPIPAPAPAPPEQGVPPGIVEPPPTGGRIERAPFPPAIRTPPPQSPGQAALRTASEKAQQRTASSKAKLRAPAPEPEPQVTPGRDVILAGDQPAVGRSQQATQAAGDLADALRPPRTGEEAKAYNRPLKAARYADALQKGGIKATDIGKIENGYVSPEQIQQGAAPRWGNIAESLGEDPPSPATIKLIKTEMNKARLRPKKAPAAPEAGIPEAGAAEAAAPTIQEIKKQANLAKLKPKAEPAAEPVPVEVAPAAPTLPTSEPAGKPQNWLDTLTAPQQESVFEVMRKVRADADRLLEQHRNLAPRYGELAVGGAHIDPMMQAYAREKMLSSLSRGATIEDAIAAGKAEAKFTAEKFNASRKGEYQVHRPTGLVDNALDQIGRNLHAAANAEETAPTQATSQPTLAAAPKPTKAPKEMTAGEINKALDRVEKLGDKLNQEFIDTGRGNELPSQTHKLSDPLATRWKDLQSQRGILRNEIERRYGPGAPSRLPSGRGFGPIKRNMK